MLFKLRVLIVVVLLVLFGACSNQPEEENEEKIKIPDTLRCYSGTFDKGFFENSEYKIINYVGANCSSCIALFKLWQKKNVENEFFSKIPVIFIVYGDSFEIFEYYFDELIDFPFPVLIDTTYSFVKENQVPDIEYLKTLLIDSNNSVELVGNPFEDKGIKKYYETKGLIF